jgi:hypothetical protein
MTGDARLVVTDEYEAEHIGLCLNVPNEAITNGLQLQISSCNGTSSESFQLMQQ